MNKFRNNKANKNQGIHTIFGQHSVRAALQNDKREHIELIISKNQIHFSKKYESKMQKITILPQNEFTRRFGNDNTCLLYTSPSPRDRTRSRMPSSA